MLDPIALAPEPTAALAHVKVGPSLLWVGGRLGADDAAVRRARGSEEFGPLDAMPQHQRATDLPSSPRMAQPRHDATLDQILLAGIWFQTIVRLGLKWSPALAGAGLRP